MNHHHHEDDVDLFNTASHNHEPLFGTTGDGWSLDNISTTTTATTTPSILIEQTSPPPVSSTEDEHTFQFKDVVDSANSSSSSTSDVTNSNNNNSSSSHAIISEPSSPTSTNESTTNVSSPGSITHTQLNPMHPLHPIHQPIHHPLHHHSIHHHLLNDLPSTSSTTAPPLSLTPQQVLNSSNSTNSILTIPSSSGKKRSRSPSASEDDSDFEDHDINSPKKSRNQLEHHSMVDHSDLDVAHHDLFHSIDSNNADSLSMMLPGEHGEHGEHGDDAPNTPSSSKKKKKQSSSQKKKRLTWTPELHTLFIEAVNQLGLNNAAPKTIHQYMNIPYLTTEHIKSHLQKYRLQMKKQNKKGQGGAGGGGGSDQPEVSEDAGTVTERRGQPTTPTPAATPHMHAFNTVTTSTTTPTSASHMTDPNKSPFTTPQQSTSQAMFGMNTMMPGAVFIPQQIQQTLQSDDPSNMDNYQLILSYMAKEDREIGRLYDEAQRQVTTADSYRLMLTGFKMGLLSAAKFPADSSFSLSPTQTDATTPTMRMQPAKELVSSPFAQAANPWASPYITRGSTVGNSQDSTAAMNNPTRIQLKQNNQPYTTGFVTMNDPQAFYMQPTSTNQSANAGNNFNAGNNARGTKIEISQLNGSTQFMSDPTSTSYNRMPNTQPFITLFGSPNTGYDTNSLGGSNRMQISQHAPASNQT